MKAKVIVSTEATLDGGADDVTLEDIELWLETARALPQPVEVHIGLNVLVAKAVQ